MGIFSFDIMGKGIVFFVLIEFFYGKGVYGNIADALNDDNRKCVEYIFEAMKELDIEPKDIAMRGGTDGSFISTKGIPTPNYFTGALNFHSNCEFMPMAAVEKSCLMTLKLVELITK